MEAAKGDDAMLAGVVYGGVKGVSAVVCGWRSLVWSWRGSAGWEEISLG